MLAHAGHWLASSLYAAPVLLAGAALWWAGKRPTRGDEDASWADDPRLTDDPSS